MKTKHVFLIVSHSITGTQCDDLIHVQIAEHLTTLRLVSIAHPSPHTFMFFFFKHSKSFI